MRGIVVANCMNIDANAPIKIKIKIISIQFNIFKKRRIGFQFFAQRETAVMNMCAKVD
jgi:hypothetical protein